MAATDKVSGSTGALSLAAAAIAVTDYSIAKTANPYIVTDSTSGGYVEAIPSGVVGWTASFSGFVLDGTVTPVEGAAAAEWIFTLETGLTFTGNGFMTAKTIDVNIQGEGDATKFAIDIQGTGVLTEANV